MNELPLSSTLPLADFSCDTLTLRYQLHAGPGVVSFTMFPSQLAEKLVEKRKVAPIHPSQEKDASDWSLFEGDSKPDSLVHLHLRYETLPKGFCCGHTLRNSESTEKLTFLRQEVERTSKQLNVRTYLEHPQGLQLCHEVRWESARLGVWTQTRITHEGDEPVVLEHLSSFSVSKLSPFAADDMPNGLQVHRFQSCWSQEGVHEVRSLEDHHLERSWAGYPPIGLRFGQLGSMPVRGYFPFIGLEDVQSNVMWGAQLAWHGSWQMEVTRYEDPVILAGSHADYDFGQWSKTLKPGESLEAPPALLTCVQGDVDDCCQALVDTQEVLSYPEPESERKMPIVFNEWCSTWGNPTEENVIATAKLLKDAPAKIFVIDDGWAARPPNAFQCNGDWETDTVKFPRGVGVAAQGIREAGMLPGIWFEFEVATQGMKAFAQQEHHLQRHGRALQVGSRHFWDFRDPWVWEYLGEKLVDFLKQNQLEYLKVDYNDSIGVGCDVPEDPDAGLGEGLRQHLLAVKDFFEHLRKQVPGLLIENCSSGGHRLEPGMVGLTSMSSFSDAHECVEIPLVAANILRLIPARKNQIWVVMRAADSLRRLHYGFAATFMGRMAMSGDLTAMSEPQHEVIYHAQQMYSRVSHIIRDGRTRLFQGDVGRSMRYPVGRQAVCISTENEVLLIVHTFEHTPQKPFSIPLPPGSWTIRERLVEDAAEITRDTLIQPAPPDFSGNVYWLRSIDA